MHARRTLSKILPLALICLGCDLKFQDTTKTVFEPYPVLLNNDVRAKADPAWSPDGNFIAYGVEGRFAKFIAYALADSQTLELGEFDVFIRRSYFDYHLTRNEVVYVEESNSRLFVLNLSSGEKRQLAKQTVAGDPAWSLDGEWIAFVARDPQGRFLTIWAVRGAGIDAPTEIVTLSGHSIRVSWSPDGDKLVFEFVASGHQIGVVDFHSREIDYLSPDSVARTAPDWSPDGSKIAFFSDRNDTTTLWTMRPDGGNPRQLTGPVGNSGRIAWSPDGSKIAYANASQSRVITIISSAGEQLREFPIGPWPVWHSDTELMATTSTSFARLEVFSLLDSSTIPVTAPKPQRFDRHPAWFPDNNTLVFTDARTGELWTTSMTEAHVKPFVSDVNSVSSGWNPAVSPDGKWLVADWFGGLLLYPLDSRQVVNLGERLGFELSDAVWNPTSTGVIVAQRGPAGLRIVTTDSNLVIDEHFIPGKYRQPTWSRAESGLNWPIAATGEDGIYVMSPDGKNQELAIRRGHSPTWSPDGLRLAFILSSRLYVAQILAPIGDGSD